MEDQAPPLICHVVVGRESYPLFLALLACSKKESWHCVIDLDLLSLTLTDYSATSTRACPELHLGRTLELNLLEFEREHVGVLREENEGGNYVSVISKRKGKMSVCGNTSDFQILQ